MMHKLLLILAVGTTLTACKPALAEVDKQVDATYYGLNTPEGAGFRSKTLRVVHLPEERLVCVVTVDGGVWCHVPTY